MMATTLLRLKTATILLALLASCGGGGGGDTAPVPHAPLSGTYLHSSISDLAPIPTASSYWGNLVANGTGGGLIQFNRNVDGDTFIDMAGVPITTAVEPSGAWHLLDSAGERFWSGGLAPDSAVGTLADVRADHAPRAGLFIRPSGTYSTAAFAGDFHGTHWAYDPVTEEAAAGSASVSFSTGGAWAASGGEHRGGSYVAYTGTGTHSVNETGTILLADGFDNFVGGVTPGGALCAVSGGTRDGDTLGLRVYVREASGASNLTFAGTYSVVALGRARLFSIGLWGTLTADGAGRWTSATTGKVDTAVAPESSSSGTYGVAPTVTSLSS